MISRPNYKKTGTMKHNKKSPTIMIVKAGVGHHAAGMSAVENRCSYEN